MAHMISGGTPAEYIGGPMGREKIVYDGKRMRKAIARKSVDPSSTLINYMVQRNYMTNFRDRFQLNPHSSYSRFMLPTSAFIDNPSDGICSRFVRSAVNKQRFPVYCCSWTPEGRRLITGNANGEFTLWNGLSFNFETILQAHDVAIRSMVWSHNGNWLVTADHNGTIKYWQSSMTNVQTFAGHRESVRSLSFSPTDFKFVSCSDDATVKIWDFESGREERKLTGHGWDVKCVSYHPRKSLLASGSKDNLVKLWDPKSGNSINTLHGHKNTVLQVAWNKNGNWLLTASRDQLIKLYDIRMLKELYTLKGHAREVISIAWHPIHESLFLSGGYDGSLIYWLVGHEEPQVSMNNVHEQAVWDIAWHPVGHLVATSSNDQSTKFWCRNRPGDVIDDNFGRGADDMLDMGSATQEAEPNILPGMSGDINENVEIQSTNLAHFPEVVPDRPTRRLPPESYICKICETKGHWIDECPKKEVSNARDRNGPPPGYVCKRCNVSGHFINDCPQAKIPPSNYTCHNCGKKGHWRDNCPNQGGEGNSGGNGGGIFEGRQERGGPETRGGSILGNFQPPALISHGSASSLLGDAPNENGKRQLSSLFPYPSPTNAFRRPYN